MREIQEMVLVWNTSFHVFVLPPNQLHFKRTYEVGVKDLLEVEKKMLLVVTPEYVFIMVIRIFYDIFQKCSEDETNYESVGGERKSWCCFFTEADWLVSL